jgi:hypothetical protein
MPMPSSAAKAQVALQVLYSPMVSGLMVPTVQAFHRIGGFDSVSHIEWAISE